MDGSSGFVGEGTSSRPRSLIDMSGAHSSSYTNAFAPTATSSSPASRKPTHRSAASISSLLSLSLGGQNDYNTLPSSPSYSRGDFITSPRLADPHYDSNHINRIRGPEAIDHAKMQNKVFCNWVNSRLEPHGFAHVTNLSQDFHDGTKLIELVEALTEQSLGRYNQQPTHRVQKFENAKMALDRIKEMGVHLTNIGPEDIVDGNLKLILGMIWSLVLRFSIADISEEGSHAKEGLLLWCQRKTQGYEGVDVQNFTRSFQDGLAFCALIHRHQPDLLDWDDLPKDPRYAADNLRKAFRIAEERLGIKQWLDVEDVCSRRPDDKSIMTYVAQFFHAFSTTAQTETEARIIGNFVENMFSLMSAVHDYERRVGELLASFAARSQTWRQPLPSQATYAELKEEQESLDSFRRSELRIWISERIDLVALLINVQTKLKTYGLRVYAPTEEFSSDNIARELHKSREAELARAKEINAMIRKIQERARAQVADLANRLHERLSGVMTTLAGLTGPLDSQLESTRSILSTLPSFARELDELAAAEAALAACEAMPSDDTVHSHDSLSFELETIIASASARKSFIENQIAARRATSVPPEELEEAESAFRAFDKDEDNHLALDELEGALGALGISEINLSEMHDSSQGDLVSFSEFIAFLVQRGEDRLTAEKVKSCFRSAAANKGYVTELDLTRLDIPSSSLDFLREWMPQIEVEGHDAQAEGACFDFEAFLETFVEEK